MAILRVQGLVKYYGSRKVVDGVNFRVPLGEVVGLLGPNGAGKTTSFRMATGQITPNEGRVFFNDADITSLPMYLRARLGMGYLDQKDSVFRKLTVEQNVLAVLESAPTHRTLGRKPNRRERHDLTTKVLEKFGLTHLRKNSAARLSGGERRRLEIARCLVLDPLVILMDEPFTGIDPPTIKDIKDIIRSLRDQGIGILITDHQAREILTVADHIYLIHQGKVFVEGSPAEVASNEAAIRTYLGHTAEGLMFDGAAAVAMSSPAAAGRPAALRASLRGAVMEARIAGLLEMLRTPECARAAGELLQMGPDVVPWLVRALEWPDMEMRRRVFEVLQRLVPGVMFDPFAPEAERRVQLGMLQARLSRRAG